MAKRKHSRRTPGTGYVTQTKNGTWCAYFPKFGGGYHARRGFRTRALAEAWLDSLVAQQSAHVQVSSGQMRVDTWLDRWVDRSAQEREWKPKTLADVRYKLGYIKPYLGAFALADVTPDHVDALLDDLSRDLAPTTMRQIRNYLHQVFEAATKRRYIVYNPVIKPERRKRPRQRTPQRLTAPQAALLLRNARGRYTLAWWIILCCGLRAGEICALRRSDIDLEQATITVAQTVAEIAGVAHLGTPKNDRILSVPFPRALTTLLRAHLDHLARLTARATRQGTWQEHDLIFPGRSGKPMVSTSLRHALKRLTASAQLPNITTHMLRHTCGGLLITVGTPKHLIAGVLRHAPQDITDHYAPADVESMRPWIEQVYALLLAS